MKTPQEFYNEHKIENLKKRKKDLHTNKELNYLKYILSKKDKILDLGCGYGRFTIPLKKSGYNIEGIDITQVLIKEAKEYAKSEKLKINFKIGDIRNLPYKKESFNSVICMWNVFSELINVNDQLKALNEITRVLKKSGLAIIELPVLNKNVKEKDYEYQIKNNISIAKINGLVTNPIYAHNQKTLKNLIKKTRIKHYKIFIESFGGRERLFLVFNKF